MRTIPTDGSQRADLAQAGIFRPSDPTERAQPLRHHLPAIKQIVADMEPTHTPDDELRTLITEGDDLLEAALERRRDTRQARRRNIERRHQLQPEQLRLADIARMLGSTEMNRPDQRLVGDVDDECSAPYPSTRRLGA